MINAADKCHLLIEVKSKHKATNKCNSGSKNKKWFDDECVNARKRYLSSKKYHRKVRSLDSYCNMVSSSKMYKKTINKKVRIYQNDVNKKLSNLRSLDPKAFRSLLNKYSSEGKDTYCKISKETFLNTS